MSDGSVYRTTNAGIQWTNVSSGAPSKTVYSMLLSGSDFYAGHAYERVWKRTASEVVVGVEETAGRPADFALLQNYPNPFNPSTTFIYELPAQSRIVLTIHDLLGREVAVLVDAIRPAGRHTADWTAAAFATGVYICRLRAEDPVAGGTATRVQKVLLLR
jgi:hypothetical protein